MMNKSTFIQELTTALAPVSSQIREEILADINEHFTEGAASGLSEEEICKNLGQVSTIAADVLQEYAAQTNQSNNPAGSQEHAQATSQNNSGPTSNQPEGITPTDGSFNVNIDKTFASDDINAIIAEISAGNLVFKPSPSGSFRITIKGSASHDNIKVNRFDNHIGIKIEHPPWKFSWNLRRISNNSLETTVYIPVQYAGNIQATSSAGNITAEGTSGDLTIKASAGNIKIANHHANRAKLSSSAGNVTATLASRTIEDIYISSSAGNVKLKAHETATLKLKSSAGSIGAEIIKISGETQVSCSAGSVNLTMHEINANITLKASAGNITAHLPTNANCRIEAKVPKFAGHVENQVNGNPDSPYVLKANASAGQIKLLPL